MTIEEGILSDDIEIIKMYTLLYLQNNSIEDLLKICKYYEIIYDESYNIKNLHYWNHFMNEKRIEFKLIL